MLPTEQMARNIYTSAILSFSTRHHHRSCRGLDSYGSFWVIPNSQSTRTGCKPCTSDGAAAQRSKPQTLTRQARSWRVNSYDPGIWSHLSLRFSRKPEGEALLECHRLPKTHQWPVSIGRAGLLDGIEISAIVAISTGIISGLSQAVLSQKFNATSFRHRSAYLPGTVVRPWSKSELNSVSN